MTAPQKLFRPDKKLVVGMIHLLPLPGSPGFRGSFREVARRAIQDSVVLEKGGTDAAIIENYGDVPFFAERVPPETIAAMTVIARSIRQRVSLSLGINVLRNDALSALAIALAVGAEFIRVNVLCGAALTDQGLVQGKAAEVLRKRAELDAPVQIWADVMVKHSASLGKYSLGQAAKDTAYRGRADALIVSGSGTGEEASVDDLQIVKTAVPDRPLLVGSGVTNGNVNEFLPHVDGFIVGTSLKVKGIAENPVSPERLRKFIRALP
jgi:membrane complex biogenesis BtpA family protein